MRLKYCPALTAICVMLFMLMFTNFVYAASPSISSINPNPVPPSGSKQTVWIYGSNFVSGCTVTLKDLNTGQVFTNRATVFYSAGIITLDANFTTSIAPWSMQVVNPDNSVSNVYSFRVGYPAPSVTGVDPNPVPAIDMAQNVNINGSNFVSGCVVIIDDKTNGGGPWTKTPVFRSSSQLTISANFTHYTATWTAKVINPDGVSSNEYSFQVNTPTPTPTISSIDPNPVPAFDAVQAITIYGSNFTKGTIARFKNKSTGAVYDNTTTFASNGILTTSHNFTSTPASWTLQLITPNGITSSEFSFQTVKQNPTYNYVLSVRSENPSSGVWASIQPLDVNGASEGTTPIDRYYKTGAAVSVSVPPNSGGKVFDKFMLDGNFLTSNIYTTVTMNANHTLTAVYKSSSGQSLNLSVIPVQTQTMDWGEKVTYSCFVKDQNNNAVSGAIVGGMNELEGSSFSVTTQPDGHADYILSVPNGKANGSYTIGFIATKSGYISSSSIDRILQVSHTQQKTESGEIVFDNYPGNSPSSSNSSLSPGQKFIKTVTIKNNGTTTWTTGYSFNYVSGQLSTDRTKKYLQNNVSPGQSVTLNIAMTAPSTDGVYSEDWQLTNPSGASVMISGSSFLNTAIKVTGTAAGSLLIKSITPEGYVQKISGESQAYVINVTDQNGQPVSGAEITCQDELNLATSKVYTDQNGSTVYYSGKVPANIYDGQSFNISFSAAKSGYRGSSIVNRTVSTGKNSSRPALISLSGRSFVFTAVYGEALPPRQKLIIKNSGKGSLSWMIDKAPDWLLVNPSSGSGDSADVTLGVLTRALDPAYSPYTAVLNVYSSGASNSPVPVTITYNIEAEKLNAVKIGNFTINANSITSAGGSRKTAVGNVNINNVLFFSGNLEIDTDYKTIKGSGTIFINNISKKGRVDLYSGSFSFDLGNDVVKVLANEAAARYLSLAGFNLHLDSFQFIPGGIKLSGKLDMERSLHTTLTVDDLSLTSGSGIQFKGGLVVKDLMLTENIGLNNLSLYYDSEKETFNGSAYISTKLFNAGGSVELIGGCVNNVKLSADGFPKVPLFATGLAITGISGEIGGLVKGPMYFSISGDFTTVDELVSRILMMKQLQVKYVMPHDLEGSGYLRLFNSYDAASASFHVEPGKLSLKANVDLGGFVTGDADLNVSFTSPADISGSVNASIQIPDDQEYLPPFDEYIRKGVGLPYTIARTANTFHNYVIEGESSIRPLIFMPEFRFSYKVNFEPVLKGGKPVVQVSHGGIDLTFHLFGTAANTDGKGLMISKAKPNRFMQIKASAIEQKIPVDKVMSRLILRINNLTISSASVLIDPDGIRYTRDNASFNEKNGIYFVDIPEKNEVLWIITKPFPGTWAIELPQSGSAVLDVFGFPVEQQVKITEPSYDREDGTIEWIDSSLPEDSSSVSLYYSPENSGMNGTLIAESVRHSGGRNSFRWDHSSVQPGRYYVYAVTRNKSGFFNYNFSPARIIVPGTIPAPPTVSAYREDTVIVLSWQRSPAPLIKSYSIRYFDDSAPDNYSVITVGDTNQYSFTFLPKGRVYRFSVAAIDTSGNMSSHTGSSSVRYILSNYNNVPVIRFSDQASLNFFSSKSQDIKIGAVDGDGDNLYFSLNEAPPSMTINSQTGTISWRPEITDAGIHKINVRVSDGKGGTDSLRLTINVYPAPDPSVKFDRIQYGPGRHYAFIKAEDPLSNKDHMNPDKITVNINTPGGTRTAELLETSGNSGQFLGVTDMNDLGLNEMDTISVSFSNSLSETLSDYSVWTSKISAVEQETDNIPKEYYLSQNYPNPFNSSTVIQYSIPNKEKVSIKIFNILGQEVRSLLDEEKDAGIYKIKFDAKGLASGIYLYQLKTEGYTKTNKLVLLK